jgi:protein-arginine kinase activator protein McsA
MKSCQPIDGSSKLAVLMAMVLMLAMMMAPGAAAQEGKCTFQRGKTTCTQGVYLYQEFDRVDFVPPTDCYAYFHDVFETTTTVYRGKSEKVLSTSTSHTQGEPYLGSVYPCV